MSWGMVAVAGATVVSGAVASNQASKARKSQERQAENQLEFEQQRLDDWQATYGDLQSNLADYYEGLTPEYYAATGLEAFETERQANLQRLEESLAQRGLSGGAIETSLEMQEAIDAAETRAEIRRDAPRMAAEDQTRFLQIGLGQNPTQSVSSTLAQRTQDAAVLARQSEAAAGQAVSSAITATGRAIEAYNRQPPPTTQLPATDYTNTVVV